MTGPTPKGSDVRGGVRSNRGERSPFKSQAGTYTFIQATPYGVDEDFTIELPRVTTILGALAKPALMGWSYKLALEGVAALASEGVALETVDAIKDALKERSLRPYDVMQEAADRGTRCHAYLETVMTTDAKVPLHVPEDEFQRSVHAWRVATQAETKVIATEKGLVNLREGYAGKCDLIVGRYPWTFDPMQGDGVMDLKTRKADGLPYESEFLQLGAYWGAYRDMTGRSLAHTGILLARPGTPATVFEGRPPEDYEAFCRLLEVYRWVDARS